MKRLIIFDLDGTLLDTIADLANATNYALKTLGLPTHDISEYHMMVGNGIGRLLELSLPEAQRNDETLQKMHSLFVPFYNDHNADASTPYPGIVSLLEDWQRKDVQLAVASNKYQTATENLVKHYFPTIKCVTILGQRDGIPPKPDAHIVNDILHVAEVAKIDTLYIGDSGVDMQTAINADVAACGVTWGFRPVSDLQQYHPQYIVDDVEALRSILF